MKRTIATPPNQEDISVNLTADEIALEEIKFKIHNQSLLEEAKIQYKKDRQKAYPSIGELVVALWESLVENDPTEQEKLQAKRLLVKQQYPKEN